MTSQLYDYDTNEAIRSATREEWEASAAAAAKDGGAGVIEVDGRRCYVPGETYDDEPSEFDMDWDDDGTDDEDRDDIIRAKWAMDGATTLSEAAAKLRELALHLERMEAEGWQLTGPVDDDYGFVEQGEPPSVEPSGRPAGFIPADPALASVVYELEDGQLIERRIVGWRLALNGKAAIPYVVNDDGDVVEAGSIERFRHTEVEEFYIAGERPA